MLTNKHWKAFTQSLDQAKTSDLFRRWKELQRMRPHSSWHEVRSALPIVPQEAPLFNKDGHEGTENIRERDAIDVAAMIVERFETGICSLGSSELYLLRLNGWKENLDKGLWKHDHFHLAPSVLEKNAWEMEMHYLTLATVQRISNNRSILMWFNLRCHGRVIEWRQDMIKYVADGPLVGGPWHPAFEINIRGHAEQIQKLQSVVMAAWFEAIRSVPDQPLEVRGGGLSTAEEAEAEFRNLYTSDDQSERPLVAESRAAYDSGPSQHKFCPECRHQAPRSAKFCEECGHRF